MNKKQETNAFVRECITTALIRYMKEKPLADVSVTELVRRAGVARVSFYRNFESKEDVIRQHLLLLIREWGARFEERGEPSALLGTLLEHFYLHKDFYLLLYKQNLSSMIYENIRDACRLDLASGNVERYGKAMFAGAIFGWIDEWARRGMPEAPEEILLLIANAMPGGGQNAAECSPK